LAPRKGELPVSADEEHQKPIPSDVELSVVDKLYTSMLRSRDFASRLLVTMVSLSAILLTLSVGIVSAKEEISIDGIDFTLKLWVLLAAGSALIPVVLALLLTQLHRVLALGDEIGALYAELGYPLEKFAQPRAAPVELPVLLMEVWIRFGRGRRQRARLEQLYLVVLGLWAASSLCILHLRRRRSQLE
jgi:hypothetical protein